PLEPKLAEVKLVDKDVDDSNRIVLMNPVFQAFRKQRALPSIRPLNKPLHTILPQLRESYDANHSGAAFSHSQGHQRPSTRLEALSALPLKADLNGRTAWDCLVPVADIALSITDWVRNLVPRLLFRYRAYLIVPNGATPLLLDEWWCVPNLGQEPNFPCSALAHIYRSPMAVGVCAAVSAQASYMELAPSYYCVAPKRRN